MVHSQTHGNAVSYALLLRITSRGKLDSKLIDKNNSDSGTRKGVVREDKHSSSNRNLICNKKLPKINMESRRRLNLNNFYSFNFS